MALRYGYFDSEITGVDAEGMPVFDRAENSELFRLLFANLVSDGVLASPGNCFQILAGDGMTVRRAPGFGMVRGAFAYDAAENILALEAAPAQYSRIDRYILRVSYVDRRCEELIRTGVAASSPVAPDLIRPASGDYYELCLAEITVAANQTEISQANIRDTRPDSSLCGYITQLIDHLDTEVFFAQLNAFFEDFESGAQEEFSAWFDHIKGQLDEDAAGHLQNEIDTLDTRLTGAEGDILANAGAITVLQQRTEVLSHSSAGLHNSIYRGADLTDADVSELLANTAAETFENHWVGDYFTINGRRWRTGGFNYYKNLGNDGAYTNRGHFILMLEMGDDEDVDEIKAAMNTSASTSGGYAGMPIRSGSVMASLLNDVISFFGSEHVLTYRDLLVNAVNTSGLASGAAWQDCRIEIPTQAMVFGHSLNGNVVSPVNTVTNDGISSTIMPIFMLNPGFRRANARWWTRDINSASKFTSVDWTGRAYNDNANATNVCVRPFVVIG